MSERPEVVIFDESDEPNVFPSAKVAQDWMEAIDVDDGVYGSTAWSADAASLRISTEDDRVILTRTGDRDLPGLQQRLARRRPEMADASLEQVQALIDDLLAQEAAIQEGRLHRRLTRWLKRRTLGGS